MKKNAIKLTLLAFELFAFLLFLNGNYILSGCICVGAGMVGTFLSLFGFELIVLIGLLGVLFGFKQMWLLAFISLILMIVSIYDFIQIIVVINKESEKRESRTEWLDRLHERELLHRLVNRIKSGVRNTFQNNP